MQQGSFLRYHTVAGHCLRSTPDDQRPHNAENWTRFLVRWKPKVDMLMGRHLGKRHPKHSTALTQHCSYYPSWRLNAKKDEEPSKNLRRARSTMMLTNCDWPSPLSWMTLIGVQGFFQLRGASEGKSTATRSEMKLLNTLFDFNKRDLRAPICCCSSSWRERRYMGQQTNLSVSKTRQDLSAVAREILGTWHFPTIIHTAPHV
jgi:hypothetical protein